MGKDRKYLDSNKLDILKTTFLNIKSVILDNKYQQKIDDFFETTKILLIFKEKLLQQILYPKYLLKLLGFYL